MSVEFRCGDPAGLAGYLYDECDAAERAAIEAHLAGCASCTADVESLRSTRGALSGWTPPDAKLGFRITSDHEVAAGFGETHKVLRPGRWWQRPLPAWAQVAAAILIFGVGLSVGIRTGGPETRQATTPTTVAADAANASAVSAQDLADLERRLRAEMTTLRTTAAPASRQAPLQSSDDVVMQRVRTLLAESEERQQRELAVRLTQTLRDVDAQRRMDLMRIEQTFGQMEGFTRPELANQRQMINYLFQRTGAQRIPE
jgi:hypothetical protein